jgi:hypothetical protein
MEENVSVGTMEADLIDETEADQIFPGKAGAGQVAEIVAQSLCIKQFVINAGSLARFLSGHLATSQCIAMFVLEAKKKLDSKTKGYLMIRLLINIKSSLTC